jgi:hypothetical protein
LWQCTNDRFDRGVGRESGGVDVENIMVQANLFPSRAASDRATVDLVSDAFSGAWRRVQISGYRFSRPGYADVMREVMAKHIVNLAERGERDKGRLRDSAFHFFTANYKN